MRQVQGHLDSKAITAAAILRRHRERSRSDPQGEAMPKADPRRGRLLPVASLAVGFLTCWLKHRRRREIHSELSPLEQMSVRHRPTRRK